MYVPSFRTLRDIVNILSLECLTYYFRRRSSTRSASSLARSETGSDEYSLEGGMGKPQVKEPITGQYYCHLTIESHSQASITVT